MPIQTPIFDFGQKSHEFELKSTENKILSLNDDKCYVKFENKIKAITAGQSIVFYDNNGVCIGGGIIRRRNIPFLGEEINE